MDPDLGAVKGLTIAPAVPARAGGALGFDGELARDRRLFGGDDVFSRLVGVESLLNLVAARDELVADGCDDLGFSQHVFHLLSAQYYCEHLRSPGDVCPP